MKLRNKILLGLAGAVALGIVGVFIAVSIDSPCPSTPVAETGDTTMLALRHRCYGIPRGLQAETRARPEPGEGEVLVRLRASAVNPAEWYQTSGRPRLIRLARGIGAPGSEYVGYDAAGVVEAVGPGVTKFKTGDEVFGGIGGAYAEYGLARETDPIVHKPETLSFEEAAGVPIAATTALQGLRDHGRIQAGQKVLINGASGGVGIYAVQIAKAYGAEVTGVCSTRNVEMVRSLGADHVIDYTREDFTKRPERYDLILDNVGNHGFFPLESVTKPGGVIVTVGGPKDNAYFGPLSRIFASKIAAMFIEPRMPFFIARINQADMQVLADLAREAKLRTAIDRRYPLARVGEALEYLGGGHARGKVIITMD